ncbi:hypothetical protein T440DRAFT_139743 [Plenodomus tracheiphilus IPT5]|uniref:Uncharacterized protein n=1 Tax=Plenodomus tracheiphilus IPT5 TaxID=1408161 RepID=A0A6A7B111_9PLEO|nr:hypothetical protein T440DRAFT_139743 [Plenodomus tracheiphilus IPT5]
MDRFKNVAKGGWHPEKSSANKSGGGPSDSKLGQVKGWVGKAQGKDVHAEAARGHQSTPLSALKDPSTFAPPPKRVDYSEPAIAGPSSAAPPGSARQRLQEKEEARRRAEEEANKPPPGPYRPDTTGLDTSHLPKPPAFRPNTASPPVPASRPKPSLPPRLPPRQNSNPDANAPPPPPTYNEATQEGTPSQGVLNQGALNRLGQAGVSVPGFGIGRTASPPVPPRQNSASNAPIPPPASPGHGSQMNELQNRLSKMSTRTPPAAAPATGTSWADKQAALRTAGNLREDPSKVNAADLRGAATTANNFQQRHGDQVASGWKAASGLNSKYGIAGKVNTFASSSASPAPQLPTQGAPGGLGKKAPPPPPPKKKELAGGPAEPPPIPLSSKPKF